MVKRLQNSFWNCVIMLLTATTRMRRPIPRRMSSEASMPASRVLPRPTLSASRIRVLVWDRARAAGRSW
ncbi:MAG: hypothetical protein BWY99_02616 [Synergistetes bacterium ADurb.BinA166]|nr:MAG: hypothetical protein BWY99_02616 [Synergistetes bacterium ADurb.BinA166]